MKMKHNFNNKKKYIFFGIVYIFLCFLTLMIAALIMNSLISRNNVNQMNETIGLIAEKVNVSFDMMSTYVEQEASILSVQENLDLEKEYYMLQNLMDDVEYLSIGIIRSDGHIYCSPGEKIDLTKYEYDKAALESKELYITEPYLSCVTGNNVITMFAPIYQHKQYMGDLFVTYPLEYVQELAETKVLKHDVESYLMNGFSGNYITCSNSVNHTAGVWGNISLIKNEMFCSKGYDYNVWQKNMAEKSPDNVLCYEMNGIGYTQAYVSINSMEDWFVVVRIPNTELTNTMHQYLVCMGICAGVLILMTMLLAIVIYFNESHQKKKIQTISEIDPLTGLLNRRAFQLRLEEIEKTHRTIGAYVFIDIDFFKEVNDNHGHAVGDEILQIVSKIMKDICSRHGIIARVGGDEFNIIFKDADMAEECIKAFRTEIKKIHLSDGTAFPIGCSIGMAKHKPGEKIETLTAHADSALYAVKRNGRDNFCWYHTL